ncbi:hypothetical protein AZE41_17480 [Sporosarcina psychrophila]|nr:hypothetical protein AZE41_17480 [Sporosarcina psychrophila]
MASYLDKGRQRYNFGGLLLLSGFFYFKELLISTRYHMMTSVISLKVNKERIVENASVPEIVSSGNYSFCEGSSILIFQATAISP